MNFNKVRLEPLGVGVLVESGIPVAALLINKSKQEVKRAVVLIIGKQTIHRVSSIVVLFIAHKRGSPR